MKTATHTITPAGLESALRYLAANPEKKVDEAAARFRVRKEEVWGWLTRHNRGKKDVSVHRIDNVLAAERTTPAKAVPAALGERINDALKKPERVAPPPAPPAAVRPPPLTSNVGKWLEQQKAEIRGQVNSFQVLVTPALAQSWLLLNQGNRNPSQAKIKRFAAAIKAGHWVLNGETLKLSVTGRLLDGQSRLRAIILAGMPAVLEIRAGLPDAAQQSMDIGEMRKGTHTLEMMGEKYPNIVSASLRWIYRWENGAISYKGEITVLENMEIAPLLKRHENLRVSVGWIVSEGHKLKSMMPDSEAAFFHYLLGLASPAKRDTFFKALATGLNLTDKSPAYHLRERLQTDRASSKRMGVRERFALIIKAWNAHYFGDTMGQLGYRATGEHREAFPVIAGVKVPAKAA